MKFYLNCSKNLISFSEYNLKVEDVVVEHKEANNYRGIASISYDGNIHEVKLEIVDDEDTVMWEVPPGSFLFLAQEEIKKASKKLKEEMQKAVKKVEEEMQNATQEVE